MTHRLASRWSLRQQRLAAHHAMPMPAEDPDTLGTPLPPKLQSVDVARLFHAPDAHELEALLAEAVRCAATLKQLRDRTSALTPANSAPLDEVQTLPAAAFCYAHELWTARLRTLEMIAAARSSLRTLAESEESAVRAARRDLRSRLQP